MEDKTKHIELAEKIVLILREAQEKEEISFTQAIELLIKMAMSLSFGGIKSKAEILELALKTIVQTFAAFEDDEKLSLPVE